MKGEKGIIGKRIVKIYPCDEYITALLDDGSEIEISDIMNAKEVARVNKHLLKYESFGKTDGGAKILISKSAIKRKV